MCVLHRYGTIIGHIAAKGLHTNLLLQVGVSEDCRFAFAGVLRGSAQMLAWDLSYLPTWQTYDKRQALDVEAFLRVHAHSDAKLKGFGAATRLLPRTASSASVAPPASSAAATTLAVAAASPAALSQGTLALSGASAATAAAVTTKAATTAAQVAEYLLICGRGIKNIHIWSFKVALDPADGCSHLGLAEPTWELVHDIPTNGMTIELIGFRHGGAVAFSRS
jgi:hypothetical protein